MVKSGTVQGLDSSSSSPNHDLSNSVGLGWGLGQCGGSEDFAAKICETRHTLQRCLKHREPSSLQVPSLGIQVSVMAAASVGACIKGASCTITNKPGVAHC
jgi:hypothetical protein